MSSFTLDQFRAILDHLDSDERTDQLRFFRVLNDIGQDAVAELGPRLSRVSASRGFRQLVFEACFYYPWPAWVPVLARALRRESDPELFSAGLVSLGFIGDAEALAALKELSQLSSQPGSKEKVAGVLAQADPSLAWDHHMERLLEGSGNPSVANEGARQLGQLVDPSKLGSLQSILIHPDLLIFRHAVRLLSRIQSAEGAAFLAGYLEECHREVLEDPPLKETLSGFKGLGLEAAREEALKGFSSSFAQQESEVLEQFRTGGGVPAVLAAQGLRERAPGPRDRFLAEILIVVAENKSARVQVLQAEALEEMNLRARRLAFAMDAGAEGLVGMVKATHLPLEETLPILEAALRLQTGREGVARALAAVAPAANEDLMDLLIHQPDNACRVAALEVLGERREEALRPFLLAACRDPISDIAQRAMVQLGNLPGAEQVARELLKGGRLEDIQLGIRFIGLHRLAGLALELLELVRTSTREELALEALEALGRSGSLEVAPTLMDLLHSGQSPQMQLALAQALRDMGDAGVAETLCSRAEELKSPLLHAVALEALVRTHVEMDPETSKLVMIQVLGAWEGRRPWANRMRVILALPDIHLESRKFWLDLASLVQSALADSKTAGGWSSQELGKIQTVAREISRRASG